MDDIHVLFSQSPTSNEWLYHPTYLHESQICSYTNNNGYIDVFKKGSNVMIMGNEDDVISCSGMTDKFKGFITSRFLMHFEGKES